MARYSRRRGPAANFEMTAATTPIPSLTITRHFDDGELLILGHARAFNGTPGTAQFAISIQIDDQPINESDVSTNYQSGLGESLFTHALHPIQKGTHTIELAAFGAAAVGDVIIANRAMLTVIQLPQWDAEDDIL